MHCHRAPFFFLCVCHQLAPSLVIAYLMVIMALILRCRSNKAVILSWKSHGCFRREEKERCGIMAIWVDIILQRSGLSCWADTDRPQIDNALYTLLPVPNNKPGREDRQIVRYELITRHQLKTLFADDNRTHVNARLIAQISCRISLGRIARNNRGEIKEVLHIF